MSVHALIARIGLALALLPLCARADLLNIAWDNDLFTGSDRGYTNGIRLTYLTSPAEASQSEAAQLALAARDTLSFLPALGATDHKHALSFSLRQLMVTPADISRKEPQFNDIPYAGHLSLSSTLWSWNSDSITGFGAHIGVIGPESGAEAAQKWAHKITGSERPEGWDNQLGSDVVAGLQAAHGRKLFQTGKTGDLEQRFSSCWLRATFQFSNLRDPGSYLADRQEPSGEFYTRLRRQLLCHRTTRVLQWPG